MTPGRGLSVTIVAACLRDGRGGSPTAVLDETAMSDASRRELPALLGTSHAVFVSVAEVVTLRFFTAAGELPACGHGTVAALAFLADRAGDCQVTVRTPARSFTGSAVRVDGGFEAAFDVGAVEVRSPAAGEHEAVLDALGVTPASGLCVASLGRPRLLVPVATRSALVELAPDIDRLRAACDRRGLLGCYAYSGPTAGRVTARMFAPSIGVPEDIANANSTACLAAALGLPDLSADMGDALGSPSTITASVIPDETGPRVRVGGTARVSRVVRLSPA